MKQRCEQVYGPKSRCRDPPENTQNTLRILYHGTNATYFFETARMWLDRAATLYDYVHASEDPFLAFGYACQRAEQFDSDPVVLVIDTLKLTQMVTCELGDYSFRPDFGSFLPIFFHNGKRHVEHADIKLIDVITKRVESGRKETLEEAVYDCILDDPRSMGTKTIHFYRDLASSAAKLRRNHFLNS